MTEKRRPPDLSKQTPDDGAEVPKEGEPREERDETAPRSAKEQYSPRHRAPGRASLIRRRRMADGSSEEVAWETLWRTEEAAGRRGDEEQPGVTPPPDPLEDVSYLGSTRAELRKRRSQPSSGDAADATASLPDDDAPGSLAPEKSGRREEDADASEAVAAPEPQPAPESTPNLAASPLTRSLRAETMVEGDVELERERVDTPMTNAPLVSDPVVVRSPDRPITTDEVQRLSAPRVSESATFAVDDDLGGPRRAALEQRKKRQRVRKVGGLVAAALAALGGIAVAGVFVRNAVDAPEEKPAVSVAPPQRENLSRSTLFFGTKESSNGGRGAVWMTLVTMDPDSDKASIVYIPAHTAVEVPGRGLQGVGEAYGSGGVPLLLVSTENLLGVKIDRYVELSDNDALVLFEALGPLTVDVPAEVRVPAGEDQARLIFVEGPQQLTPSLLVKLLYIVGIEGDDVELGSRHLAFWDQLLDEYDQPEELGTAIRTSGAALGESDATPEEHAEFLAALAELPAEDVTLTTLPVRPISAGDSELYATDAAELASFVDETIGLAGDAPAEVRVQVLNGNGVPGIGQEVGDELVGEGFRVILSGNARRLNYRETLIITYDNSEAGVALAERARELLGVGEVQVSAQQQGIVDLTIVVGKDFLRAR